MRPPKTQRSRVSTRLGIEQLEDRSVPGSVANFTGDSWQFETQAAKAQSAGATPSRPISGTGSGAFTDAAGGFFATGTMSHLGNFTHYGTLILSRFPIVECRTSPLPRAGDGEQRGLTHASIDVRGVPVQFYNTHLHTAAADRLLQTAEIARVVDSAPAGVAILAGDFNARPDASEMAPIFARFTDAWQKAAVPATGNSAGYTSPAHPTKPAVSRIDYVLVRGGAEVKSVHVPVDARTRHAADHYPVIVDITLPPPRPLPQGLDAELQLPGRVGLSADHAK